MVVAFCGDEYNKGDLYSEEVERQFNQYVKPILEDKAILFSWNASHGEIHEDCMLQILQPDAFQNQTTGSQKKGAKTEAFISGTTEHSQMRHSSAMDQGSRYNSKGDSQGTARAPVSARDHPLGETTYQSGGWQSHQIPGNVHHQDRDERGDDARSKQHDTRYQHGRGQSHQIPGNAHHQDSPQGRGTGQTVTVLKTRLRYGRISYEKKDLEIMEEGLEIPVWLVEHLQTTKSNVKVALLEIHRDASGNLNPTVTEDMSWYQKAKSYAGM